jgi:4-oxalocrotonate tautomerase family enzyme
MTRMRRSPPASAPTASTRSAAIAWARRASRVAAALAWDSVLFGGRTAVAAGWLERAARLLEGEPVCPEQAWLAVREAEVALASGEPAVARVAAQRAIAIAGELSCEEVQVVGRSLEGLSLVYEGLVDEGMRRLDESAVAATAGDVKDLMWVGKVCCNLIAACERVGVENVFNSDQKREIIERLTDTMVEIEGENMRSVTWVTIEEVASGEWGIAGNALTAGDAKALQAGVPA